MVKKEKKNSLRKGETIDQQQKSTSNRGTFY